MVGGASGQRSRLAVAGPDQELPPLPLFPLLAACSTGADRTDLAMLHPTGHAFLHPPLCLHLFVFINAIWE